MSTQRRATSLGKLTAKQRATLQKEYQRLFRVSISSVVAAKLGVNRTTVWRTLRGHFGVPDPKVELAIWDEIQKLIQKEDETGTCHECPLRAICERLSKGAK